MNFFLIQFNLPLQKQNLRHQGTQKVIELWTDSKQTGDSDLVQGAQDTGRWQIHTIEN
jgi:hypothetical protein